MKVLILGVSGMLGNAMARVLPGEAGLEVFGVGRRPFAASSFPRLPRENYLTIADIHDPVALRAIMERTRPDAVINAVGLVKQLAGAEDPLEALPMNALLPHRLARLCAETGARLIHVSTDCVFDGTRGNYTEDDRPDATDLYGRSKLLGEVDYPGTVTLRTSIVGHEIGSHHGLFDWFLAQEGQVAGYRRAIFSGVTTVEFARLIARHVLPNRDLRGLYHVSADPISKHDLLGIVAEVYGKRIDILPRDEPAIDRSLRSDRFRAATGYAPPDWPTQVRQLRDVYTERARAGSTTKRVLVTGSGGLLGRHCAARLHARNCGARYRGEPAPFEIVRVDRAAFNHPGTLEKALAGADAVLHFAGVNRGTDEEVEGGNIAIAERLAAACKASGAAPHIVYANSTHAAHDTPYGRSKRRAGDILSACAGGFTDLVLPHIFGEGARPFYNNVTATFIHQVARGETPNVNPEGRVQLLHAGAAAEAAIGAFTSGTTGEIRPEPRPMGVAELLARLQGFHVAYAGNVFPDLSDPFDLALFNTYRAALYPDGFPRPLRLNTDVRGVLFEAAKGGGGGQTFLSWTEPGVTRGNHFHLDKVERFLVLEGEAVIRIRRVLGGPVWEFRVDGRQPAAVDMPTLHTHSIENVGDRPLLTLFWTQAVFDPAAPDTYADPVLE